jgi:hypothetical protein
MATSSEAESVEFMELHCSQECLWNISVAYKNRDARRSAYKDTVKSKSVTLKRVASKS